MSTIGNVLKDARNKKAISLEEVHSRTKIHPRVLQLLEEDKFEKLPSPVFVKSFLRSYAEFLEVNPEEMVRRYEKEDQKDPPQVLYIKPAAERDKSNALNFDKSLLVLPIAGLVLVALLGVLFLSVKTVTRHFKEKRIAATAPKSAKAAKQEAAHKSRTSKTEAAPATTTSAPAADSGFNADDWLRHPKLGNFPKIGKREPLRLKIKAADSVWLRLTCDGKVLFQNILHRGVAEAWTANDHFEIWTGNASSMVLSLNNYDLGSPGQGVTKKMVISRDGVRNAS